MLVVLTTIYPTIFVTEVLSWLRVGIRLLFDSMTPNFMDLFYVTVTPDIMGLSYVLSIMGLSYVPENPNIMYLSYVE